MFYFNLDVLNQSYFIIAVETLPKNLHFEKG